MRWDDFDQAKVRRHFDVIKSQGATRGLHMRLGYEVFYKTLLHKGLDQAPRYVLEGTNALLLEFNTGGQCSPGWEHIFYELQTTYGIDITVAHPERYSSVIDDFDIAYRMKDMGCRLEVSAGDLFGRRRMTKCAKRLLKEGLVDAIVSDAHRPEHYRAYMRAMHKYANKI